MNNVDPKIIKYFDDLLLGTMVPCGIEGKKIIWTIRKKLDQTHPRTENMKNSMNEIDKKEFFKKIQEFIISMNETLPLLNEVIDKAQKEETEEEKSSCTCCKNNDDNHKIHMMIHLLLPVLNSHPPTIGYFAMKYLICSIAIDNQIEKDEFLKDLADSWDNMISFEE